MRYSYRTIGSIDIAKFHYFLQPFENRLQIEDDESSRFPKVLDRDENPKLSRKWVWTLRCIGANNKLRYQIGSCAIS